MQWKLQNRHYLPVLWSRSTPWNSPIWSCWQFGGPGLRLANAWPSTGFSCWTTWNPCQENMQPSHVLAIIFHQIGTYSPMTHPKWCAYWTNCHLRNVGLQVWRWTTGHLCNFKPSKTGRKMLESLIGVLSSGRGTDLYRFVPILFEVHWMGKPVNLGKHLTPQIYLVV